MDLIPGKVIEQVISNSGCDTEEVSKYYARKVLNVLVFSHVLKPDSQKLRALVGKSHSLMFQFYTTLDGISRSGFSDALTRIDADVFKDIFEAVLEYSKNILPAIKVTSDKKTYKIKILDSTWINLSLKLCPWAVDLGDTGGSKVGITIDLDTWFPDVVYVTAEKSDMNDNRLFPKCIDWDKSGYTYLHDAGSFKVATFDKFVETGNHVIARKHGNLTVIPYKDFGLHGQIINEHCQILNDSFVWLGKHEKSPHLFRCVTFENLETGEIIQLITNRFDLDAMEIAMLYLQRWQIEILFRWLKSHLKLNKIINYSENGFKSCIYAILTFHVLMACYRALQKKEHRKGWTDTLRELQAAFENQAMICMFILGVIFALKFNPT